MSRVGAFIPIKSRSNRVTSKNFRLFRGRPLYQWIIDHAIASGAFDAVHVDTDSDLIAQYATDAGALLIHRRPELAADDANGNDLLVHHGQVCPDFDYYFQLFATAPTLRSQTIRDCVRRLEGAVECGQRGRDSIFTATRESGWYWFGAQPVNFRPGILPRSQDAPGVIKETTGLYGITRAALTKYYCRIGARPIAHIVSPDEAVDLDTERDFQVGEVLMLGAGERQL
ncbi:acylneuraminate cytidylyltransferase family protein [Planctomycetales bacterium ZRK34]|nr:acylneuraminate cytidylyltransferase family protein [Planctomycetales bacterium ZRK34]